MNGDEYIDSAFKRAERQRPLTSFHEAGHVAAHWWLKLGMGRASILMTLSHYGVAYALRGVTDEDIRALWQAAYDSETPPAHARRRLEATIKATAVGKMAATRAVADGLVELKLPKTRKAKELHDRQVFVERITLDSAAKAAGEDPGEDDDTVIRRLMRQVTANEREAASYEACLRDRAWTLVGNDLFWRICRALAEALQEHTTLSGRACRKIVQTVLTPPSRAREDRASGYFGD